MFKPVGQSLQTSQKEENLFSKGTSVPNVTKCPDYTQRHDRRNLDIILE